MEGYIYVFFFPKYKETSLHPPVIATLSLNVLLVLERTTRPPPMSKLETAPILQWYKTW